MVERRPVFDPMFQFFGKDAVILGFVERSEQVVFGFVTIAIHERGNFFFRPDPEFFIPDKRGIIQYCG